jgi:hypothetical protein
MYQRDEAPVELVIEKAARERNLYCYHEADGNLNSDVEKWFERIESAAYPALKLLNDATEDFDLSLGDWQRVSEFLGAQLLRTPAWRRKLEEIYGAGFKAFMMKIASDDRKWDSTNREAPSKFPDLDLGKLRRFVLSADYDVGTTGGAAYFLSIIVKSWEPATRSFFFRNPILLRTKEQNAFVTSDSPVLMVRHPKSPDYMGTGVINSKFLVPIGSARALYLGVPLGLKEGALYERERVRIKVANIGRAKLRAFNGLTIRNAERFVFAAFKSRRIAELFASTKKPQRFKIQSPPNSPFIMVRSE